MPIPILTLSLAWMAQGQTAVPLFNDADRASIGAYWSKPERYAKDPDPHWVVRLTPEGSKWLLSYNKARGLAKTNPEVDAPLTAPDQAAWENWIDAKVAFDRARAAAKAAELNSELTIEEPPVDPGPIPAELKALAGTPTEFACAVRPNNYTVTFDDGGAFRYVDSVNMRPRYAHYRCAAGVTSGGKAVQALPVDEMNRLCSAAGLTPTERKVMAAVSPLEGGFDSVNTYDTGLVSIGFIQFACLKEGGGSLGAVLSAEKAAAPDAFASDFHRFGLDVTPDGKLDCLDPVTGQEFTGADAAEEIIQDKRLTAAFQRAGQMSDAFKIAQLRVARDIYYPTNDTAPIASDLGTVKCRVCDFVRSEAGLATLMDRKVNTGNLGPLALVIQNVMEATGAKTLEELASHEMEIVEALTYRKDFLADPTLSQPAGVHQAKVLNSRHGDRKPRKRS